MLELRKITKRYETGGDEEFTALDNISLIVEPGSSIVIVGTNGSGKSTLLNIVAGGVRPDLGNILFREKEITNESEHRRARMIGRVFQSPYRGTVPNMTIMENLALASRRGLSRGMSTALTASFRKQVRDRVSQLGIGLESRLDQKVSTLSGGQRQALTLLMATWRKPQILLLDEHTASLDPKSAEVVLKLTGSIINGETMTVLMVTHSMQQAIRFGDRLLMMHRGKIVLDLKGNEKKRARASELFRRFDEIRRADLVDEAVSELLKRMYV